MFYICLQNTAKNAHNMKEKKTRGKEDNNQLRPLRDKDSGQFKKGNNYAILLKALNTNTRKLTPEELINGAKEYFDKVENNPIQESVIHQRTGEIIHIPRQRPLTVTGFCQHIGITYHTFLKWKEANIDTIPNNTPEEQEKRIKAAQIKQVCAQIELICYNNKIEGAAVNIFNAVIVSRVLGLKDRQEIDDNREPRKIELTLIPSIQPIAPPQPQALEPSQAHNSTLKIDVKQQAPEPEPEHPRANSDK